MQLGSATASAAQSKSTTPSTTAPASPNFATKARVRPAKTKSSVQLELEQVRKEVQEQRKLLQRNARMAEQLLHGDSASGKAAVVSAKKHHKPATQPQAFTFATAQRSSAANSAASSPTAPATEKKAFVYDAKTLTEIKPFAFATDARSAASASAQSSPQPEKKAFVSLVERTTAFNMQALRSSSTDELDDSSSVNVSTSSDTAATFKKKLTSPHPFKLHKTQPRRPLPKSFAEQEEARMQRAKHIQFKARPLSARVMQSCGDLGVPRVAKKEPTVFAEFQLSSSSSSSKTAAAAPGARTSRFKARPLDKSMFAVDPRPMVRARSSSRRRRSTRATSPKLATSRRPVRASAVADEMLQQARADAEAAASQRKFKAVKARPMPDTSRRSAVVSSVRAACTQPQPFRLQTDQRGAVKTQRAQSRVMRDAQKQAAAREFKAQPIVRRRRRRSASVTRSSSGKSEQQQQKRSITPNPFELQSMQRHEQAKHDFEEHKKQLQQLEQKRAEFKARPLPQSVLAPVELVAVKSTKPLTETTSFNMQTAERVKERATFDKSIQAKQLQKQAAQKEADAEAKSAEDQENRAARQASVIKAQPVRHFKPVHIQKSHKPLTTPFSPSLGVKARAVR
jgi:hypothetical protein